jgi:hypothetical protein
MIVGVALILYLEKTATPADSWLPARQRTKFLPMKS